MKVLTETFIYTVRYNIVWQVIDMIKRKSDIGDAQVTIIELVVNQQYDDAINALLELQEDIERIRMWA